MNDYACILIWDAHTRMGHNIVPYAYGISHTRMGRPIRVWDNIRIWGRTLISRISYECRWGLTGFYPTKELCFDVTTAITGFNSVAFEAYQHCMAWGIC